MSDATPILDVRGVRRAIAGAEDQASTALRRIVVCVAAGATGFSTQQRQAAGTLCEVSRECSELRTQQLASSDAQLLKRAHELKQRADRLLARASELAAVFPSELQDDDIAACAPLDVALEQLVAAVTTVAEELHSAPRSLEPRSLLWTARRLAAALEDSSGVFDELASRMQRWCAAVSADHAKPPIAMTAPTTRAFRAHLAGSCERLHAAGRGARLTARRGTLDALWALHERPCTDVRVRDTPLEVSLRDESATSYHVRARSIRDPDPFGTVSDDELPNAIGAAVGLNLGDLAQRRQARDGADRARRQLAAIVAYRDSARRGDSRYADSAPNPSDPELPDALRPDSRDDLSDLLLDLVAERWPVAAVLRDSLATTCRALGNSDPRLGIMRLLAHPDDDRTAARLVRRLSRT